MSGHNRLRKDMGDLIGAMEREFGDAEADLKQEFESQREEIKNKNSEEYNVLKIQLEGIIEELERHFEQAHKAYQDSTESRTAAFKQLTKNDAMAARVIEKRMKKLVKMQEALAHWRNKIGSNMRTWEERNRALRNEKEVMHKHYAHLKATMDAFRAQQNERLKQMAIATTATRSALRKKLETAQSILKLAEVARKYESEQEKVLPFFTPGQAVDEEEAAAMEQEVAAAMAEDAKAVAAAAAAEADQAGPSTSAAAADKPNFSSQGVDDQGRPVEEWDYLNRFFRKFNKVVLDKAAIDKEKARLQRENDDLRAILKQYLDGISVNDDVLNNPVNSLMVVNQRLQITLTERNRARIAAATAQAQAGAQQATPLPAPAPQLVHVTVPSGAQ